MSVWTVTAERTAGGWWVLEQAELGAVSQVRRLDQAEAEMREAVAHLAGEPEEAVEIMVQPILPEEIRRQQREAREARETAEETNRRAAAINRRLAHSLADSGMPLRDIGRIMGVSHQRAGQLVGR